MNLFKKIWLKNLQKNREPIQKFVEDIGAIKGKFTWTKIDPLTHKPLQTLTHDNAVTINGRTSIVRLLAQSANSNKTNDADSPARYKISRMRFGNALDDAPLVTNDNQDLHYYDISEISYRLNRTPVSSMISTGDPIRGAGGRTTNIPVALPSLSANSSNTFREIVYNEATNPFQTPSTQTIRNLTGSTAQEFSNLRTATDIRPAREPSHGSVVVVLRNASNQVIEAYRFGGNYNKSIQGNKITEVAQPLLDSVTDLTTLTFTALSSVPETRVLNPETTSLYYDSVDRRWKIRFINRDTFPGNSHTAVRNLRIELKIGAYNVVDSIVPAFGFNTGAGTNNIARFGGQRDSYSITNSSYSDGASPIDDYQVSFSVIMAANEGNGENPDNLSNVRYNEAFLFNEREDMFSIIRMPSGGEFFKNQATAYLLTWQLTVDPV